MGVRALIMLLLAALAGSSCSSAAPQRIIDPRLVAPQRSQGGVTVWLVQIPRQRPFSSDICDHLAEHLLGRALYVASDKQDLPFGVTIDGQTSVDKISILISHGGGALGIRAIADMLERIDRSGPKALDLPPDVIAAERRMVEAEESEAAQAPQDVARLMGSLAPVRGQCNAQDPQERRRLLERAGIIVLTEVAQSEAAPILENLRAAPPEAFDARTKLAPTSSATDLYLARAQSPEDVVTASAVAKSLEGYVPIQTERLGGAGLLVRLGRAVPPGELAGKVAALPAGLIAQQAEIARSSICAKRASSREAVRAAAIRLANDAWALAATSTPYCEGGAPGAHARAHPDFIPLGAPQPPAGVRAPANPPMKLTACCLSQVGSDGSAYYVDVLRRLLINQLRFRQSMTEGAGVIVEGPRVRIALLNSLVARADMVDVLHRVAKDPRLSAEVTRAQRDMCVEMPLAARTHNSDADCTRSASVNAVSHVAEILEAVQ